MKIMPVLHLSSEDRRQLAEWEISEDQVRFQWELLNKGTQPLNLVDNVQVGSGVRLLEDWEEKSALIHYAQANEQTAIVKFVPASGAASRMFKEFNQVATGFISAEDSSAFLHAWKHFHKLPFYESLKSHFKQQQMDLDLLLSRNSYQRVIQAVLHLPGLNLNNTPKLLVPFHHHGPMVRTALEEHLVEAARYACCNGVAHVHFTVSEAHEPTVKEVLERIIPVYQQSEGCRFEVELSQQSMATNTIALTQDHQLFRHQGNIYTRAGGHGALLKNLQTLTAPMVYIKNVDNVFPQHCMDTMVRYKQVLGGLLLQAKDELFELIAELQANDLNVDLERIILKTLNHKWGYKPLDQYYSWDVTARSRYLFSKLNRPLRVIGVLKTTEPTGGGPYWVKYPQGISIQVVEDPQIADNSTQNVFKLANRFANVTDLVIYKQNYLGQDFDLNKFSDPQACFISNKSFEGQLIKALELPGLWNGSMADWNTMLVQVPVETFAPVKTVYDLLKDEHQ